MRWRSPLFALVALGASPREGRGHRGAVLARGPVESLLEASQDFPQGRLVVPAAALAASAAAPSAAFVASPAASPASAAGRAARSPRPPDAVVTQRRPLEAPQMAEGHDDFADSDDYIDPYWFASRPEDGSAETVPPGFEQQDQQQPPQGLPGSSNGKQWTPPKGERRNGRRSFASEQNIIDTVRKDGDADEARRKQEFRPPLAPGAPGDGMLESMFSVVNARSLVFPGQQRDPRQKEHRQIVMPTAWLTKMQPQSVHVWPVMDKMNPELVGVARLAGGVDVKFGAWQTHSPATRRHIRMAQMLSHTGFVPRVHEVRYYGEVMWLLTEWSGMRNVGMLIEDWKKEPRANFEPVVPLDRTVPLMIDILRGLVQLERVGVVHTDLSEKNLFIIDDYGHVVIDDLRSAAFLKGKGNHDISPAGLHLSGETKSSHEWAPPEMKQGLPDSVASNTWQAGLIFARFFFGDNIYTEMERAQMAQRKQRYGFKLSADQQFSIRNIREYRMMYQQLWDLLNVVERMLDPNPQKRWSAVMALHEVMDIAQVRGIRYYPERKLGALPYEWQSKVQAPL